MLPYTCLDFIGWLIIGFFTHAILIGEWWDSLLNLKFSGGGFKALNRRVIDVTNSM
jgi:hypothetical protein